MELTTLLYSPGFEKSQPPPPCWLRLVDRLMLDTEFDLVCAPDMIRGKSDNLVISMPRWSASSSKATSSPECSTSSTQTDEHDPHVLDADPPSPKLVLRLCGTYPCTRLLYIAGDQPSAALEGEVGPGPFEDHDKTIAKPY